ncbi:MAG: peptidoglycan DD-metalloendopeptidase family protein [Actinotalea sp.]|nr:peptidoglycan DD-metalloendopeptidase family protein [Actinotalea sp.]
MPHATSAAVGLLAAGALVAGLLAPVVAGPSVRTAPADAGAARQDRAVVVLPLEAAVVVRGFEEPTVRWGPGHRGVDLAAPVGATVLSPAAGVVVFAGRVVDRDVVTVRHDDGLRSSLEPVTAVVDAGSVVAPGDVVGLLSTGGHCAGCVHWGVRDGERYLDPLGLLPGPTVRLLPERDAKGTAGSR